MVKVGVLTIGKMSEAIRCVLGGVLGRGDPCEALTSSRSEDYEALKQKQRDLYAAPRRSGGGVHHTV